jgi:hypothetical protein
MIVVDLLSPPIISALIISFSYLPRSERAVAIEKHSHNPDGYCACTGLAAFHACEEEDRAKS